MDIRGHPLRVDNRSRVRSAWQTAELCEVLIVLVDAQRQIERLIRGSQAKFCDMLCHAH